MNSSAVKIDPMVLSGTPCIAGTRVSVKSLFDYLEAGDSLDEFLDQFPSVPRQLAVQILEDSRQALLAA